MGFTLDERLAASSHLITAPGGIQVRLADDARFVWLLLIPEQDGISELHDLEEADRAALFTLANELGVWMKDHFAADKINTAAIGNLVAQLHLHVVARHRTDSAWPAPIWGAGDPQPRSAEARAGLIAQIAAFLDARGIG